MPTAKLDSPISADIGIGGFFGLERAPDAPRTDGGALATWSRGEDGWIGFHNARSAFAHLLRSLRPGSVWLPRYLCADMRDAVTAVPGLRLRVYDVDPALRLADANLAQDLGAGDLVVAVGYFGAPVCSALSELAAQRADVTWVEDRAQTLVLDDKAALPEAWRLYSLRKILGVADGGLLFGPVAGLDVVAWRDPPASHGDAARARSAAATRDDLVAAYRRYQEIEAAHQPGSEAMSVDTRQRLQSFDVDALAERRRLNFSVLDQRLQDVAAPLAERLRGVRAPFGYPVSVPDKRDQVAQRLAADGCFCAVHWRALVEDDPPATASRELSRTMLTLPVDHRYDGPAMEHLADCVLRALP